MVTMELVNKPEKRRRWRCKNWKVTHIAPPNGHTFPAVASATVVNLEPDRQGLSPLHVACMCGKLATVQPLLESRLCCINSSGPQGRRPIHMVLSSRSSPNTSTCLRYLLENGADINVTTDAGQTPLHLAASEGLLDCTEMLVRAGADVLAQDCMGHTPLDLARFWCRRKVARYLKNCMWQADKKKEMEERKLVQALYSDLVDMCKLNRLNKKTLIDEKMADWAHKKSLPLLKDFSPRVLVSQYHTQCLSSDQDRSTLKHAKSLCKLQAGRPQEDTCTSTKPPPASASRPWTIYTGLQPEKPPREPDLRSRVTLWKDGSSRQPQYTTKWDSTPRAAPDLPVDVLERVLFPRAFPSRIASPRHFEPQDILEIQHRGCPQGSSTSPWTEVAMHLAEVLEPGHY
ncbi:ankyrin repeat domain-containing protein 53 isoform X2 [Thunnus maccoyii]|uniref:ankyrin repeat domain-containing protein 53 isoform X2 n=1 Tax=Thunnus maccoyii TaxID=8240 RepID=UPI001C4B4645|nr:ankyrin repeat domain-containing protein 53 isoform X2 [Thunnus maccoyii]